ncbi:GDSL-type esterase/lipase family protein [Picosynechococcus sp. PCC 73109]|uniref:GDSL-type esterase/lipase family protein n=1 Tax=Picosynechococcus sp. PCC 73109 TaxID=374982 RepID=UPI0007457CDD|nr:GDSL-type esterase/lipase family protein [Picosynechococcus sp. PCC 73109]AMA08979.1 G-D-S-L family lipolytic protein [Picosynechococcus sp. PCC 73109]
MTALSPTHINPSYAQRHPLRVVAFGDSLVYGFGDPVRGGWVEQLRLHWMGNPHGHVLYNLGVRGDTVKLVGDRLGAEYQQRGELRNKQPDLILLSVGVNDSPRLGRPDGKSFTDFDLFQSQLDNLLAQAQQLCPVIFIGQVPVNEAKMPFLDCLYYSHSEQYRYKELTKKLCGDRQIPYLDIFDLWLSRGTHWVNEHLSADGLHPNSGGYAMLFQDVINWQAIAQLDSGNTCSISSKTPVSLGV